MEGATGCVSWLMFEFFLTDNGFRDDGARLLLDVMETRPWLCIQAYGDRVVVVVGSCSVGALFFDVCRPALHAGNIFTRELYRRTEAVSPANKRRLFKRLAACHMLSSIGQRFREQASWTPSH